MVKQFRCADKYNCCGVSCPIQSIYELLSNTIKCLKKHDLSQKSIYICKEGDQQCTKADCRHVKCISCVPIEVCEDGTERICDVVRANVYSKTEICQVLRIPYKVSSPATNNLPESKTVFEEKH